MTGLIALTMLLFQGLAICTIGGMASVGMNTGLALSTAVFEVVLGALVVRWMRRDTQRA